MLEECEGFDDLEDDDLVVGEQEGDGSLLVNLSYIHIV